MAGEETRFETRIEAAVTSTGLLFLGCVRLSPLAEYTHFRAWLRRGQQAGMAYLERNHAPRRDPRQLGKGYRSAIIVGLPYGGGDRLHTATPRVAQYARIKDYHKVIKKKAQQVIGALSLSEAMIAVDTAPLLERALAVRGGKGFIGKNTCFISAEHGSYILLGEIFTGLELPVQSRPHIDSRRRSSAGGCGSCRRCQVHCPTGALDEEYRLDANKCLSYHTIENRGEIPQKFKKFLGNYFYGCDICQIVCPWNRPRKKSVDPDLEIDIPPLEKIATMSQAEYEKYFGGTAMTRAKRSGLMRNAKIALTQKPDQ